MEDLRKIVSEARAECERRFALLTDAGSPIRWRGRCAQGARILFRHLRQADYQASLVASAEDPERYYSPGHCYVVWDSYVLDVTATQFGAEDVVVMRTTKALDGGWWWGNVARMFRSEASFVRFLTSEWYWPPEDVLLRGYVPPDPQRRVA